MILVIPSVCKINLFIFSYNLIDNLTSMTINHAQCTTLTLEPDFQTQMISKHIKIVKTKFRKSDTI